MEHIAAMIPPMGWNSWDSYGTTVTEAEVLDNARVMSDRLSAFGWDTVVVDIDWYDPSAKAHGYNRDAQLMLDAYGRQVPDPVRFPSSADGSGFTSLSARIHDMGLKFGVHVMRGIPRLAVERNLPVKGTQYTAKDIADYDHICGWNPDNYGLKPGHEGSQAWYDAQVDQLVEWGVDFIKVDDMQVPFYAEEIKAYSRAIAKAGAKFNRDVLFSLSPGGGLVTTHVDFLRQHANMWRISDDLWDRWEDVYAQFSNVARWAPLQMSGHWADADMLPLGHIGLRAERGESRHCALSRDEQRSMLTLWAMGRSPLMVGGDLPTTDEGTFELLANPMLREVTAGSTGNGEIARSRVLADWTDDTTYLGDCIVWRAVAADWADGTQSANPGGYYAAVFWTGDTSRQVSLPLQSVVGVGNVDKRWRIKNLWDSSVLEIVGEGSDSSIDMLVPSHGVVWMSVRQEGRL